jgi:predicted SprT family Zn-dependent metalloprotease
MDLNNAEKLAKELIAEHCPEYTFQFDNAKVRFGYCNWNKKIISLSKHLVLMNDEEQVKDTILHEIAHALTPKQRHNSVWRAKAIEIGCDGNSCCDDKVVNIPKGKYVYQCPICEEKYYQHRRYYRKTACGKCCKKYNNNKYSKDYELVFLGVLK